MLVGLQQLLLGRDYLQSDINLSQGLSKVIRAILLALEVLLCATESLEQRQDIALVCLRGGGKSRLVDTVVDLIILPLVRLFNLILKFLGVQVDAAILFINDVVKLDNTCVSR